VDLFAEKFEARPRCLGIFEALHVQFESHELHAVLASLVPQRELDALKIPDTADATLKQLISVQNPKFMRIEECFRVYTSVLDFAKLRSQFVGLFLFNYREGHSEPFAIEVAPKAGFGSRTLIGQHDCASSCYPTIHP